MMKFFDAKAIVDFKFPYSTLVCEMFQESAGSWFIAQDLLKKSMRCEDIDVYLDQDQDNHRCSWSYFQTNINRASNTDIYNT